MSAAPLGEISRVHLRRLRRGCVRRRGMGVILYKFRVRLRYRDSRENVKTVKKFPHPPFYPPRVASYPNARLIAPPPVAKLRQAMCHIRRRDGRTIAESVSRAPFATRVGYLV